jgi:predicted transposase YbfD/YdcC
MTPGFPEPARSSRIRRGVGDLDNLWTTKEIVYGIASLLASPNTSGCYERQHWTVGNRLHWTRDVTSHENFPQLRTSTAARALASCRNLAINTFRLAGRANIADARRDLHSHDDVVTVYASNPQQSNRTKITTPEPWLRLG